MLKRLLLALLLLCTLCIAGMVIWLSIPYEIDRESVQRALVSDETVSFTQQRFDVFSPVGVQPAKGLIFYPGGKADPDSYAPLLRELASSGLLVVTVPMPLHMALLAPGRADAVMQMFPEIEHWYLAGHSMGGVAAVEYAAANPDRLRGLILWAAYPNSDISQLKMPVLSVYGSRDNMTTIEEVEGRRHWLPDQTRFVLVDSDHWQFGHFARGSGNELANVRAQGDIINVTLAFITSGQ